MPITQEEQLGLCTAGGYLQAVVCVGGVVSAGSDQDHTWERPPCFLKVSRASIPGTLSGCRKPGGEGGDRKTPDREKGPGESSIPLWPLSLVP